MICSEESRKCVFLEITLCDSCALMTHAANIDMVDFPIIKESIFFSVYIFNIYIVLKSTGQYH